FSPALITGSGVSVVTITTVAGTAAGNYTITLTGTSGGQTRSATVTLTVIDFSIGVSPSSQAINAGGSATYTATVGALNGFSGAVALSVSGLPSGATASFSPASIAGAGTSTV